MRSMKYALAGLIGLVSIAALSASASAQTIGFSQVGSESDWRTAFSADMKAEAEKDAATRQKGLESALATFATMQPDDKGPRYAYALYHQGRVQALLGKTADAKATLEKAKAAGKALAELEPLVDARLASLGT